MLSYKRHSQKHKHIKLTNKVKNYIKKKLKEDWSPEQISGVMKKEKLAWVSHETSDNGKEFAYHEQVAQSLDADFYFANPYHSWERGLNEHTNGLIRQYLPKQTDFTQVKRKQIRFIQDRLNNRPRKSLGFKTPAQVFYARVSKVMAA